MKDYVLNLRMPEQAWKEFIELLEKSTLTLTEKQIVSASVRVAYRTAKKEEPNAKTNF